MEPHNQINRVKICGIVQPAQGAEIVRLGATALGFICVRSSPRYLPPSGIRAVIAALPTPPAVDCIGVFADAPVPEIIKTVEFTGLTAVQLHGNESTDWCDRLRDALPDLTLIKAFRVKDAATLDAAIAYAPYIDTLLLDAYRPGVLGGTGATLDWDTLRDFRPPCPWWLAGGLTPENVAEAIALARPQGIDLSSGVERQPGDKCPDRLRDLFRAIAPYFQGKS